MSDYERTLAGLWASIHAPRAADAPKTISLFAGGGGSSMGYKANGADVRLAVEWEAYPAAAYRLNFPETPMHEGDVAQLTVAQACELARVQPGELDVLDGSPPCQGFSTAGKREIDDPRNSLFREFVRLLRGLRPRAFVMENVSGMVKGTMRWVFRRILEELRGSGYEVRARLMNAKWYGVPQSRSRVIILGIRNDLSRIPTHPTERTRPPTIADACPWLGPVRGTRTGAFKTGWETLSSTKEPSPTVTRAPNNVITKRNGWNAGRTISTGEPSPCIQRGGFNGSGTLQSVIDAPLDDRALYLPAPPIKRTDLASRLGTGQGLSDISAGKTNYMKRLEPAHTSDTVVRTPDYYGGPAWLAPNAPRGLSVGEVMRLSSFPDEYKFPDAGSSTWAKAWGVCGNSVPPLFMRAIARALLDSIAVDR